MTFNEYQELAKKTARYPKIGKMFVYPTMGLCSEAGEVASKVKKVFRDKNGVLDKKSVRAVVKELGDTLWYISQIAAEIKIPLDYVALSNLRKVKSRKKRGKIKGSGDNR